MHKWTTQLSTAKSYIRDSGAGAFACQPCSVNRTPIAPKIPPHLPQRLAFSANLFANRIAHLMRSLTRTVASGASSLPLRFAAGARKVASFPRLFPCVLPRFSRNLPGMLAGFTRNFARLRAVPPVPIRVLYVCVGATGCQYRNQQHPSYPSRHTASFFKVQTNEFSFCSENFRQFLKVDVPARNHAGNLNPYGPRSTGH